MIEAVMFAALGFLAAAGLALSLVPVLWRRAERLTRRRIEAVLPMTAAEFRAERDQARADYAVKTRRLEIELDEARRRVAHELAAAGRNAEATTLLKAELQAKSQALAELDARSQSLVAELRNAEERLSRSEHAHAEASRLARERAEALAAERRALDEMRALADGRRIEIAALVTKVEALKGQVAQLEEAERDAKQRIADLDAARRGATAALAQARERHDDTQRQLAESERRLTEALRRIASIDEDRTRLQTRLAERAAEIPRLEGAAGAHERSEALLATERRARGSGEGLPRAESARPLAPTGTEPDQPTGEDTSRKASAV
jgi:chromosome segregation ATPase